MKSIVIGTIYFLLTFFLSSAAGMADVQHILSGKTMGTYYTIKFISAKNTAISSWKAKVDMRLKEVNSTLSMYDPKSEISQFNRHEIETPLAISLDFYTVLLAAEKIYHLTDGAWDGTVKPLVDLWGFGTEKMPPRIPENDKIILTLSKIGFNHIDFKGPGRILKTEKISLDLGSIAKGYGVDAIADLFLSSGINNVLVEIGGELYAAGKNKKGEHWSVGISRPDKRFADQGLFRVIRLKNQAIATSGNYRNFFEMDGKMFSHIIDPKTGFPVDNNIVSTSVISEDCTFADGLATALMVMDVQKGLQLVNRLENTECLIIQKKGKKLISHASENFDDVMVK